MSPFSVFRERDSLSVVRVQMKTFSDVLDRKLATRARANIERELTASAESEALVLDFRGVRAITVPFVDECLGVLLAGRATGYYGNQPVLAVNANDDVRETLALALAAKRLALLHASKPPELLGGDSMLRDTLREAWLLRTFTASDIADKLEISPQAANNRLSALVRRGALRRALVVPPGGGKEFLYAVPDAASTATNRRQRPVVAPKPARPVATS